MLEPILNDKYKTDWHFETPEGEFFLLLSVDDESSEQELEVEMEYWMEQMRLYDPPKEHKKAIYAAVRWMGSFII